MRSIGILYSGWSHGRGVVAIVLWILRLHHGVLVICVDVIVREYGG